MASLAYHAKTHWIGPVMGFGVLSAGAQMGATLAMSYSLDCHREVRFLFLSSFTIMIRGFADNHSSLAS
jgi:hypothetical protein